MRSICLTVILAGTFIIINSCASHKVQIKEGSAIKEPAHTASHTFYLIGDAGYTENQKISPALTGLQTHLKKASSNSTLIFLGDNIYPDGLPQKESKDRALAESILEAQVAAANEYPGRVLFIPGNHDWSAGGLHALKRQEKWIEEKLGKNSFLPENGCPIKSMEINDHIVLVLVDSQWFLEDWDNYPTINDDCDIKTREDFFIEIQDIAAKNQNHQVVIALHHPPATNGAHGGKFTAHQNLYPFGNGLFLPGIGNLINGARKTGGISPQDIQSLQYRIVSKRLLAIAQTYDNVIFVSGHDHTLQYLTPYGVPVLISGAGSKTSGVGLRENGKFGYGGLGFAELKFFEDGSSWVSFFGEENNFQEPLYQSMVTPSHSALSNYSDLVLNQQDTVLASVYSQDLAKKGSIYKALWGEHYRPEYGLEVSAPIVKLDTLHGGLIPVRKGGGKQSMSLRLRDSQGREWNMRSLKKNALKFIQTSAFKDQFIKEDLKDTYLEELLLDYFTTFYPYASFAVADLAEAADLYHTRPELYYVPKQPALGPYNDEYGDGLYLIEKSIDDEWISEERFGKPKDIISSSKLINNLLRRDEHIMDEKMYIRARLFDMLIGDWDRHADQWRWAEFELTGGRSLYRPIPRDRDVSFSRYDGFITGFLTRAIPELRLMQSYDDDLRSVRWFNSSAYTLDMLLLQSHDGQLWKEEASFLRDEITDEVIEKAFANLPKELQGARIENIKSKLKGRRENLPEFAEVYFSYLRKFVVLTGTEKDDYFTMDRKANGDVEISIHRIKDGKKVDPYFNHLYRWPETKEIWIYGLDDTDTFELTGEGSKGIKLRIVGGKDKDTYLVRNESRIKIYDHKNTEDSIEPNGAPHHLSDDYDLNTYDYRKRKENVNHILPIIGYNPDDGFKIGFKETYIKYALHRNPFSQHHQLKAGYYFATNGFDLRYQGEFANIFDDWNFGVDAILTTPNFAINYFGIGNETENDTSLDFDYNRVKYEHRLISPSLIWRGHRGGFFKINLAYETIEIEKTPQRYISEPNVVDERVFNDQRFVKGGAEYRFENVDNIWNPKQGMSFRLSTTYIYNLEESENRIGQVVSALNVTTALNSQATLTLASQLQGQLTIGDNYIFYQGASIGGDNGLRGFRQQRFTGRHSFYQNTDLRWELLEFRTGFLPLRMGIYGGFDYGRVWAEEEDSGVWHTSQGGGMYFNAINSLTINFSLFNSTDGNRFAFGLGFHF